MRRDIDAGSSAERAGVRVGRSVVAVVGIDCYVSWSRLGNAVSDAAAASRLFRRLGFAEVTSPLLDDAATGDAMRRLVTDDLAQLSPDDSLVLFFAGHGHTHTAQLGDLAVKTGYVIPVEATHARGHVSSSWIRLDTWLSDIARLPPRHILVIVDACYSGISLSAVHRWRAEDHERTEPLAALQARRSRRIITSALDDQRAMDGGPYPGHSLFTGCLIEALSGGLAASGHRIVTGRQLGQYLQQRVTSYPGARQTPDFGTFELDDRGDIVVPLDVAGPAAEAAGRRRREAGPGWSEPDQRQRARPRSSTPTGLLACVFAMASVFVGGSGNGGARCRPATGRALDARPNAASNSAVTRSEPAATMTANPPSAMTTEAPRAPASAPLRHGAQKSSPPTPKAHRHGGRSPALDDEPTEGAPTGAPSPTTPAGGERSSATGPALGVFPVGEPPCNKATFAVVYEATSPTRDEIHGALHALKQCRDAGMINETDLERYQAAVVTKL